GKVLVLSVRDNGRGYDMDAVPSDRMGLTIISERAAAIGAELEMESEPGVGTSIHVYWRADEEEE
ncbi:MAG: ATP-binding protein, partial [Candidatus Promineifilaceae bacterium]